jgi:hypothetical protein
MPPQQHSPAPSTHSGLPSEEEYDQDQANREACCLGVVILEEAPKLAHAVKHCDSDRITVQRLPSPLPPRMPRVIICHGSRPC